MIIVKKGNHYPNIFKIGIFPKFYLFNKTSIKRKFKFTKESVFVFDNNDIYDYSKLFGLSFGHHQKNDSFRFGFRFLNNNEVELSEYMYIAGKRKIIEIPLKLQLNKIYNFKISLNKNKHRIYYIIYDENNNILFKKEYLFSFMLFLGYTLGLYIGGNNPAPKKLKFFKK